MNSGILWQQCVKRGTNLECKKSRKMKNESEKVLLSQEEENLKALLKVNTYKVGAYTIDVPSRMLTINGESTKLTTKESLLLTGVLNSFVSTTFVFCNIS